MDVKHVRSAIIDAYNRTVGKSIDAKTLQYLATTVSKGENSLASIIHTLMNTEEYKERAKSMFTITFFDAVGSNPTPEEFEQFWSEIDKSKVIEGCDIELFVRKTPSFQAKYKRVVENLFSNQHAFIPNDEITVTFLNKLASNIHYNDAALAMDIKYFVLSSSYNDSDSEVRELSPSQHATEDDPSSDQPITMAIPCQVARLDLDVDRLSAFEAMFGRHMYVKEYFKYVVNPSAQESTRYFSNLDTLRSEHTKDFNCVSNIYASYCNTALSEHQYVDKYLMDIDRPNYIDTIIDNIVNTPDHKVFMCATLQAYFKKLYDLTMDESDLSFLFNKVRCEKLHPKDERLVEILKEFKAETDDFIDHIFKVYMRALERQPDMYEIETQLLYYRTSARASDIDAIDKGVAAQLTQTLEFHDIIKKHIKNMYFAKYSKDINPSRLFQILQEMVEKVKNDELTIETLDTCIESSHNFTSIVS